RGAMIESLSEDYVRTARAKGLSERKIVLKHALRSALVTVVTIFGIDLAFLLSGTIFTEKIFALEGIGQWGLEAVKIKDLPVEQGKTLGIVGESGSGKSVSSMAVLGLHDAKRSRIEGSIRVGGTEVVGLSEDRMRQLRGNDVAMIFQDALAALHPFYKVGSQ